MNRRGADPKVKKTLVRNYDHKVSTKSNQGSSNVNFSNSPKTSRTSVTQHELNEPTVCSSEALAIYMTDMKKSLPVRPQTNDCDKGIDKEKLCIEMTKKLNFHFNDRIYKNLVELNTNAVEVKTRKDKKLSSNKSVIKKDLEPKIEDFYEEDSESDTPPKLPVIKPKFKAVQGIEDGHLHKLVANFDNL